MQQLAEHQRRVLEDLGKKRCEGNTISSRIDTMLEVVKMPDFSVDVTNACNLDCIHCLRDKSEPRKHLSLDLFKQILDQARDCGIKYISLTGGEPTLHPKWSEFLNALAERELKFSIVSNGYKFSERTLPVLLNPLVRKHLESMCFSLDGAFAKSHDTLRGEGSFREIIEAANLCRLKGIPLSIKTVVTSHNKRELTEIALLGSVIGAIQHSFIALTPTPRAIEEGIVPSIKEMKEAYSFVTGSLVPSMKTQINLEGSWGVEYALFTCNAYQQAYSVDHLGNLLFCCNLSHVCNGDKPSILGKEFLADLKKEGLKEGIIRHYRLLAQFTEDRLNNASADSLLTSFACWWCLKYFNKLEWIENYANSPWVQEVFS